jgi:hypothetical protein
MANPKTIAQELSDSLGSSFPRVSEYDRVYTLLMFWEEDDLGCAPEVAALSELFTTKFNYTCRVLRIPSQRAEAKVTHEISDLLLTEDAERRLIVVYYGGHGRSGLGQSAVWAATV